ncbi:hypothetical protein I7I51_07698 [Histoplasma capsulatum]|uniref:Uncharacterized protein n=1 Tax=Ajellomyces capsulatus TaxID=5037 RepID=A0A8A1LYG1_AJECA|nr:hypothetical protein I7I51_07698 [Histoplasma capsulatum]
MPTRVQEMVFIGNGCAASCCSFEESEPLRIPEDCKATTQLEVLCHPIVKLVAGCRSRRPKIYYSYDLAPGLSPE